MKKLFKIFLFCILGLLISVALCIPVANIALKNESIRNKLLHAAALTLRGSMVADELDLSFGKNNFILTSKNIRGHLFNRSLDINIPRVNVSVPYIEIVKGSFFPHNLDLFSPNISYVLRETKEKKRPKGIDIEDSISSVIDNIVRNKSKIHISNGNIKLNASTLSGLSIQIKPDNSVTDVKVAADIFFHKQKIPVKIDGYINTYDKKLSYKLTIDAKSVPLTLIPKKRDFFFSNGNVDLVAVLTKGTSGIEIGGNLDVKEMEMRVGWTSEDNTIHQEKPYYVRQCSVDFTSKLMGRKIEISKIDLQSEEFNILGSLLLDFSSLKNPSMDLRFKTGKMEVSTLKKLLPDPLISDWTTQTIFPRIENGKAQITNFVLAGTMDEIGSLNEPENAHCLAWSGLLTNVDTFYNDHKPLGKIYTANLAMDGDLLTIKNISGKSGKNLLTMANVFIENLYSEVSHLKADIEGSFDLFWLKIIFSSGVTGNDLQQLVSPVTIIKGQNEGKITFALDILPDTVSLTKLNGKGASSGPITLQIKDTFFPINIKKTFFNLKYPGTSKITVNGSWGKSPFKTQIDLIELDKKQHIQLSIDQSVTDLQKIKPHTKNIKYLNKCITSFPILSDFTYTDNNININCFINNSDIKIKQECYEKYYIDRSLTGNFKGNYKNDVLNIQSLKIQTTSGNLTLSGRFTPFTPEKKSVQSLSLTAVSFPLRSLAIFFPDYRSWINEGFLDADIDLHTSSNDKYWPSLIGNFNLKGWQGSFADPQITVNNVDIKGNVKNGHLVIHGDDLRMDKFNAEYPVTFEADLEKDILWKGTLRLFGDYLDLTTSPGLFKNGKADLEKELPFESLNIYAKAGHVRYRNLIFTPLLVQAKINKNKIIISKALIEHGNDLMWLTGSLSGNDVVYNSYFRLRDTPVNPFLSMIGFESKSMTGDLDMEGKLTAKVTPGATFLETSKGLLSFAIKDGTLESSSSLVKILDLISLENIFDKQDVLSWKNSFKFDVIQGRFDLDDGIFTTDSFIMDASAFDIFGQGTIDAVHDTIDMKVKLAPFGTINKIFSSIPYLGYVLTGKSKSLFDYLLSVKGNIDDPDVQYLPLKGTLQSLSGYIKRLVSGREKISKEINRHLQEDMDQKNTFIHRMDQELAPLSK